MNYYSVVPPKSVEDPRQLLYWTPSMHVQKYAKLMQEFHNHQMMQLAETMARNFGYELVPSSCLHWEYREKFPRERRVMVGKKTFYLLKRSDHTKRSLEKYEAYVQSLQNQEVC